MSARREHPLFLFDNRTVEKAQVPLVHPLHIRYSFLETDGQPDVTGIAFIADKMCMSHSTLYRKVKALMNISVNELVRDAKMRHAATLLESGEYTVTEVSDMTGFSSVPYFRQRFKEKYGMSPSEFMKKK